MTQFTRHALFMFLALRAGDLVNLAAGMWLVPRFVSPEELGAVLPVTTFATLLALPVFAFGMAVMKVSADLAGHREFGRLKSLWRGVFTGIALLAAGSLALTAALLPGYLRAMRIADSAAGFFVLAAALLGSMAPVYTDALQSVKRFRALGTIELSAAVARLLTMAVAMPFRAFAGYFAGNAMQPVVRIGASVFSLRRELAVRAERYWTRENALALLRRFALITVYVAVPMAVAACEQTLIRERLAAADSAGYYMASRLSDLINYLTFPLLLVLFPYAAEAARNGRSTLPLVARLSYATLVAALLLGGVYALWGRPILSLIPHGADYTHFLPHLPTLLAITALTACQTFYTNAEVAAGRHRFLRWFVPMNLAYLAALELAMGGGTGKEEATPDELLTWLLGGAMLRFACALAAALWKKMPDGRSNPEAISRHST